jgi:hypothetical protein
VEVPSMTEAWVGLLLSVVVASPSPQPALKTIITVHSSPFCSALTTAVKPALFGLMRNDQLIGLGRSALVTGGADAKYGGEPASSFNQQSAATWSTSSGDTTLLNSRQRQIAAALEHNIETIDTILANPKQFVTAPTGDEQATLAAIKSQLNAILNKQRTAESILGGTADSSDLAGLYNSPVFNSLSDTTSTGTMDSLGSASPLSNRLASQNNVVNGPGRTTDPTAQMQVQIAHAEASKPLSSPYEKLARAVQVDQVLIEQSEDTASKTIVDAAAGCK